MTDEPLLMLRQVADELRLPESTVRYYRDAFLDHIPSVGTGRRRRYPPAAVAVLRSVAEGYAAGKSREQILHTMDGAAAEPAHVSAADEKTGRSHRQPAGISNLELLAAIVDGEREQRDALWQMAKEILRLTEVLEGQEKVLTEIADHAGVTVRLRPALDAGVKPPTRALGEGRPLEVVEAPPPPPPPPAPAATAVIEPPVAWQAPPPPSPLFAAEGAGIQTSPPAPLFGTEVAAPGKAAPTGETQSFAAEPPPFAESLAEPKAGSEPLPPEVESGPPPGATGAESATVSPSEMERLRSELEMERQLVERLREAKVKLEHRVTDAEAALEERRPRRRASVLDRILKPDEER